MSKVVSGVGRAIGSVVKGVVNGVKSFAKSSVGKVIIGAAAVYFGGAALMGAMGSGAAGAAGLSGLAGAAEGIGAAWTSLGTAGTAAMAGEFGQAASALGSGIGGSAATMGEGGMLINGSALASQPAATAFTGTTGTGLPTVAGDAANIGSKAINASPWTQSPTGLNVLAEEAGVGATQPTGFIDKMMANKYAAPALIQGSMQLGGGLIQGYGAQKAATRQEELSAEARARYNTNMGTRLFA